MQKRVHLSSALPGAVLAGLLAFSPLALAERTPARPLLAGGESRAALEELDLGPTPAPSTDPTAAAAAGTGRAGQIDPATAQTGPGVAADKVKDRLDWPVQTARTLTSPYGPRLDPIANRPAFHTGADFAEGCGSPILAAADGEVTMQGPAGDYGYRVVLAHEQVEGKELLSTYSHLQEIQVTAGAKVKKGDVIGLMGTTGYSTGCHLHFEVVLDGWFTDPWTWITGEVSEQPSVRVGSIMPLGPITTPSASPTPTPSPSPTPTATPTASASASPTKTTAAPQRTITTAPAPVAPQPVVPAPERTQAPVPAPVPTPTVTPTPSTVPPATAAPTPTATPSSTPSAPAASSPTPRASLCTATPASTPAAGC